MRKILDLFKLSAYKDVQPHHHHISLLIVGKILLIIILIILIKPAFTGFTISNRFGELNLSASEVLNNQEKLMSENNLILAKLESCDSYTEELEEETALETDAKNECLRDRGQLEFQFEQSKKDSKDELSAAIKEIEGEKREIRDQLNDFKIENEKLERDYDEISDNSANNICCKLKVDDSSIDSYSIVGNRIVCGSLEDIALSC